MIDDTIAAIATAPGEGGIAIVRVSGPDTYAIADRILSGPPPSQRDSGTFAVVNCLSPNTSDIIDEVVALFYRAPASYTREDVLEIQSHGGSACARRVLRACLDAGARPAEPGEFTQRAFLNGRIDLIQAEGVLDLIRARSDRAAATAYEQLKGSLSQDFNRVYDDLIAVSGDLEATLDFAEAELPAAAIVEIKDRLKKVQDDLDRLLGTWQEGHLLREGALAVISGKPNVGKSTLLNRLLGTDRAIVTSMPGTTRDFIEETLIVNGIPVRLVDTAGLRRTEDAIEAEGIERAYDIRKRADIQLFMLDASQEMDAEDQSELEELDPKKTLVLLNKQDLGSAVGGIPGFRSLAVCLLDDTGLATLREAIAGILEEHNNAEAHAVISERHRNLLATAREQVREAHSLIDRVGEEAAAPAALSCRLALEGLGSATGRMYHDELLSNVFSRFCVGK